MDIDMQGIIEDVTKSELLGLELASWNQPRNTNQLLDFIARREAAITDIEDGDNE